MQTVTVLLAEDEPVIALDMSDILLRHGFHILPTDMPGEIIALCDHFHPEIAILNVRYKDYTGAAGLAQTLMDRYSICVLIVTGCSPDEVLPPSGFDASCAVLHKPFTSVQLRDCLRRLTEI